MPLQRPAISLLILDSTAMSCELNLLLPFLVKDFVDEFIPFLVLLCNSSLAQGCVPALHKMAVVSTPSSAKALILVLHQIAVPPHTSLTFQSLKKHLL